MVGRSGFFGAHGGRASLTISFLQSRISFGETGVILLWQGF